jgi:hypothetical protein
MCPCPVIEQLGIQKPFGFVAAESNKVPACRREGVPESEPIWYQREPLRFPPEATPPAFTRMLCAVHSEATPVSRFLWICAAKRRSSSASSAFELPCAGWLAGDEVAGTVRFRLPEMLGVPPGSVTRRRTRRPKLAMLEPMK